MFDFGIGIADLDALAAEILEQGDSLRFQARGSSMRPFIRDGDVLSVQPAGTVRRGDVVLCRVGDGSVLVHRVVRVSREQGQVMLLVQGDALLCPDGIISLRDVLGRVVTLERGGRRIMLDTGLWRLLGLLWVGLSPFIKRLYRALAALKCWMPC